MRFNSERVIRVAPIAAFLLAAGGTWMMGRRWPGDLESMLGLWLAGGVGLGILARAAGRAGWTRTARISTAAVACAGIALLGMQLVGEFGRHASHAPWRFTVAGLLLSSAILPVAILALTWKRNLAVFAVGAGVITILGGWLVPGAGALVVFAFLFSRDVGRIDTAVPARQSVAIAGAGALVVLSAVALAFDLAASIVFDPRGLDVRCGMFADEIVTRWPRMLTEGGVIAASCALARGRTWGVLGLAVLGPALVIQLFVASAELPFWQCGCIVTTHPLDYPPLLLGVIGLAVGPWLLPVVHRLR